MVRVQQWGCFLRWILALSVTAKTVYAYCCLAIALQRRTSFRNNIRQVECTLPTLFISEVAVADIAVECSPTHLSYLSPYTASVKEQRYNNISIVD
jgi:hypothetical protein